MPYYPATKAKSNYGVGDVLKAKCKSDFHTVYR